MKTTLRIRIVFALFLLWSLNGRSQSTIDGRHRKDIPFFVEYNQLETGFLSLEADCRFLYGDIFPTFRILGLSAGYNPVHNDLILEQKTYFNFIFLSAGLSLAYIDQLSTGEKSAFGIKPQIGLDIYFFRFYYGYQFSLGNRPEYLNHHNLALSFFVFGKDEFYKRKENAKWYSWRSIFKNVNSY